MLPDLFKSLSKKVKQAVLSISREPPEQVDDFVLEHLLLYHGLVGTTPDNQRTYKDVRADVLLALENESPRQLGIALKLSPLWWEDKLKRIFTEAYERYGSKISTVLLPATDELWPSHVDPLGHPDWRVRANTALVLAFLEVHPAVSRIDRALRDSATNSRQAFCHIAYALGRLPASASTRSLVEFLLHDEPWFRIDAAGALAEQRAEGIEEVLTRSLLQYHDLHDYASVVIARRIPPQQLLNRSGCEEGVFALALGVIEASKGTFATETVTESQILSSLPQLAKLSTEQISPLRIRAMLAFAQWLEENRNLVDSQSRALIDNGELPSLKQHLLAGATDSVLECISHPDNDNTGRVRHAIKLAGELRLNEAGPHLLRMVRDKHPFAHDAIASLGSIGFVEGVPHLVQLARESVDMRHRISLPPSRVPINEDDAHAAKTYWLILKALGGMADAHSISLLLEATEDFAPDKREQAFESLISVCSSCNLPTQERSAVTKSMAKALQDPAAQVRSTVLRGVGQLGETALVPEVIKLTEAAESSVNRQAFQTLVDLADNGHKDLVLQAANARLKECTDPFRKQKLADFVASKLS